MSTETTKPASGAAVERTRSHGVVRGLSSVDRSPIDSARFGRMFRWLKGETYPASALSRLAMIMIQREHAHFRQKPQEDAKNPTAPVTEGPDLVFNDIAGPNDLFLDTVYGDPEPGDENPVIPAGYTYFGQFIDHDLTFDPNSSLQKQNDPDATADFRIPRFDLDSLYGRGPDDQPYLYKDHSADGGGIRFLLGRDAADPTKERRGELPRNVEGRALVGDPRNDENNIICQIQALFLNFHNKVVDTLLTSRGKTADLHALFLDAQRIVRWHYQYLVLNDYLPRIVGREAWKHVYLGGGAQPAPQLRFYKPKASEAYMPVEFSVAAFRFGHSMIRPSYALRRGDHFVGGDANAPFAADGRFHRVPIFSDRPDRGLSLNGFGPLHPHWEIDWRLFFSEGEMPTEPVTAEGADKGKLQVVAQTDAQRTQPSYRIDTTLVDPLAMLPPDVAKSGNQPDGIPSLAFRNLLRGSAFALPSGESVARAYGHTPLTDKQIWGDVKNDALGIDFTPGGPDHPPFHKRTPLWFYILKEAELQTDAGHQDAAGGHHLGFVGGRIVAEVLVGIASNDHTSFLHQDPLWTPEAEKDRSGFDPGASLGTIYQLIHWTTDATMTLG